MTVEGKVSESFDKTIGVDTETYSGKAHTVVISVGEDRSTRESPRPYSIPAVTPDGIGSDRGGTLWYKVCGDGCPFIQSDW